jgi:methionyl aminopeptidase
MIVKKEEELIALKRIGHICGYTLTEMIKSAKEGMTTKQLDDLGNTILNDFGARSAPILVYNFPGATCISVNNEVAHGIPSDSVFLKAGDLINIDVSAELDGYYSDNGASFVLEKQDEKLEKLCNCSKKALFNALKSISDGVKCSEVGRIIEKTAKDAGLFTIRNLCGHGVGRSIHEYPREIPNFKDHFNRDRLKKNMVVAIETFISQKAEYVEDKGDGWTLLTSDGSLVAQYEHTILVTSSEPIILTESNKVWTN